jgi:alpha-glucosidase
MSVKSPEWWRGAVIYQIYPRSFMDSNGDGVGDLPGILQKLDHVASVGADAIWVSPFFKSPMKDYGYDVSDYRDVDPVFGTIEDFKRVVEKAHDLGIKVLIDQVWSHTSDQHDWFKESRQNRDNAKADWYVWADPKPDGTPPNNWMSWFGGAAWTWDSRRMQYYLHHFLREQPALNTWNPEVRQAIKNIAAYWLDMGVDGFRLDVANLYHSDKLLRDNPVRPAGSPLPADPPPSNPIIRQIRQYSVNQPENIDWIEELRAFVDQWPERCLLAEAGCCEDSEATAADYTKHGNRFNLCYAFGLLGSDMGKTPVLRSVGRVESLLDDGWVCWAVNNHDFRRSTGRIPGPQLNIDKSLYASALGLSLRGSYCMYQGEELALANANLSFDDIRDPYDRALYPNHVGRDGARTPMPWNGTAPNAGFSTSVNPLWITLWPEHVPAAVDTQESDTQSTLHHFRKFMQWRKNSTAMRLGTIEILETADPVLAFRRTHETQSVTCVFNCSEFESRIAVETIGTGQIFSDVSRNVIIEGAEIILQPYGYCLLAG